MVEGFAPHVGGEEPLRDLGMTECCAALLPLAFSLQYRSTRKDGEQKLGKQRPCALTLYSKRRTMVFRFNAGAPPSNTKTGLIP
jgi:hypothetical protein